VGTSQSLSQFSCRRAWLIMSSPQRVWDSLDKFLLPLLQKAIEKKKGKEDILYYTSKMNHDD
jgi:hypothetical protein